MKTFLSHPRALSSHMVNGMFLLRVSQRSGTQLVVSVWYKAECKHFKIFQVQVCVCGGCMCVCVCVWGGACVWGCMCVGGVPVCVASILWYS